MRMVGVWAGGEEGEEIGRARNFVSFLLALVPTRVTSLREVVCFVCIHACRLFFYGTIAGVDTIY